MTARSCRVGSMLALCLVLLLPHAQTQLIAFRQLAIAAGERWGVIDIVFSALTSTPAVDRSSASTRPATATKKVRAVRNSAQATARGVLLEGAQPAQRGPAASRHERAAPTSTADTRVTLTEDANYGVQSGMVGYLPNYVVSTPTAQLQYGTIVGRANLVRSSRASRTTISAALFVSNPLTEVAGDNATINIHLYTGSCTKGLQKPYHLSTLCEDSEDNGCTDAQLKDLAEQAGHSPTLTLALRQTTHDGAYEGTIDWPVHLPEIDTNALSLVVHDLNNDAVPMCCGELIKDRSTEGMVFSVDPEEREIPHFVRAHSTLAETGWTEYSLTLSSLRPQTLYTARVHALPCIAGDGTAPSSPYQRDLACALNPGAVECQHTEDNEISMQLQSTKGTTEVVTSTATVPRLTRASAQSIVIYGCQDTGDGNCSGSERFERFLMCVDLVNTATDTEGNVEAEATQITENPTMIFTDITTVETVKPFATTPEAATTVEAVLTPSDDFPPGAIENLEAMLATMVKKREKICRKFEPDSSKCTQLRGAVTVLENQLAAMATVGNVKPFATTPEAATTVEAVSTPSDDFPPGDIENLKAMLATMVKKQEKICRKFGPDSSKCTQLRGAVTVLENQLAAMGNLDGGVATEGTPSKTPPTSFTSPETTTEPASETTAEATAERSSEAAPTNRNPTIKATASSTAESTKSTTTKRATTAATIARTSAELPTASTAALTSSTSAATSATTPKATTHVPATSSRLPANREPFAADSNIDEDTRVFTTTTTEEPTTATKKKKSREKQIAKTKCKRLVFSTSGRVAKSSRVCPCLVQ